MSITIPIELTDDELMTALPRMAGDERVATARLVAHLAELERRKLYVPAGYPSLYTYCRERLGLSEDAAHNRKVVAQVALRYPAVLDSLADGRVSLTAVRMLATLLRDDNWEDVFSAAAGKAKREIEVLVARLAPKPDVPSTIRKLPARSGASPAQASAAPAPASASSAQASASPAQASASPATTSTAAEPAASPTPASAATPQSSVSTPPSAAAVPERQGDDSMQGGKTRGEGTEQTTKPFGGAKRPIVAPLSADRYRVQFTIGGETEKKLRRLQELLRREIPGGDPAVIFDRALTLLLAKVENRKNGATARPRAGAELGRGSRRIPSATRREVAPRDSWQCAFVAADGRRCTERAYLEYHHAGRPFAHGGGPGPENVALHCRAHNAHEGKRIFGAYLPPEVREARAAYDAMRFAVPERPASGTADRPAGPGPAGR